MNRRALLKNFILFSAGSLVLPACLHEKTKSSILLKNLKISSDDEKLMAELSETIIPKTEIPGARDISSHLFVLMMVDDCSGKNDQDKFMKGLEQFDSFAKKKFGKSFVELNLSERNAWLSEVEAKKEMPEELLAFYSLTKKLTIQSFLSSKYYLTNVQVYELVPSRFHGCVPVKSKA
ncbi:MAG TPA: gluconate 2-dehydrogenase subunit 3 family protein [Puia sp.]|nr:gluconate 2-dehydrogenase subunit 3 family protein [Puia sp.]